MSSTANAMWRIPRVFAGASRLSPRLPASGTSPARDVRCRPESASSRSPPVRPRAPRRGPPSDLRRSRRPAARVRARRRTRVAAARSSTTMPTCSIRWIVMCSMVRNQIRAAVPGAAADDGFYPRRRRPLRLSGRPGPGEETTRPRRAVHTRSSSGRSSAATCWPRWLRPASFPTCPCSARST
jgi:hypothetical protein